jgi:hypothetical protein
MASFAMESLRVRAQGALLRVAAAWGRGGTRRLCSAMTIRAAFPGNA